MNIFPYEYFFSNIVSEIFFRLKWYMRPKKKVNCITHTETERLRDSKRQERERVRRTDRQTERERQTKRDKEIDI